MKQFSIYFKKDDIFLYEEIVKLAKKNRLTVNSQILKILEEYFNKDGLNLMV